MKLCWQALIFKYLYTFKPGGESAFGSSPPASRATCSVTCGWDQFDGSHFRAGSHVHTLTPRDTCLFRQLYSCTTSFSHDRSQSTAQSQDQPPRQPTECQYLPIHKANRKSPRLIYHLVRNGPTCYTPQTPTVQHHLQQTAYREDARRKARLPPHRKTCHRPQVR